MALRVPLLALCTFVPGSVLGCADVGATCWEITTLRGPPAPEERFEHQRALDTGQVLLARHLRGGTLLDEEVTLPSPGGELRWRRWGEAEPRSARFDLLEGARRSGYEDVDGDGTAEHRWSTVRTADGSVRTDRFDNDDDGVDDRTEERRYDGAGRLLQERAHGGGQSVVRSPVYGADGAWRGEQIDTDGDGRTDDLLRVLSRRGPGWEVRETVNGRGRTVGRWRRDHREDGVRQRTTERHDHDGDGRWDARLTTLREGDVTVVEEDSDGDGRVERRVREHADERGVWRESWSRGPPHDRLDVEELDHEGRVLVQSRHVSGAAGWVHRRSLRHTFGASGLAAVEVDEGPERSLRHRVVVLRDSGGVLVGARDAATARSVHVLRRGDCPGPSSPGAGAWLDVGALLRFLDVPRGL